MQLIRDPHLPADRFPGAVALPLVMGSTVVASYP